MKITDVHFYDDIINLPHHVSKKRKTMARSDRAAQFGAFAALTGHSDQIAETGRYTDKKTELSENAIEILDAKLQYMRDNSSSDDEFTLTYFEKDKLKPGGCYRVYTGSIRRMDDFEKRIYFTDGFQINIDDIYDIQGECFKFTEGFSDR